MSVVDLARADADDSRPVRVAIELSGAGRHPAALGSSANYALSGSDGWVDLTTGRGASDRLDPISVSDNIIRIQAADLQEAQRLRRRLRAEAAEAGRDPNSITVLVDLEVLVAADAHTARVELTRLDAALEAPRVPETQSYIGTPAGLAGLIADIHAVHVADGVTILPLALPGVLEHLVRGTLPWLENRGLVTTAGAVDEVLRRLGLYRSEQGLAS